MLLDGLTTAPTSSAPRALRRPPRRGADDQGNRPEPLGRQSRGKFSWYEPLTDPDAIPRAVHYVLGNDQLFLNSTSDATLLPAVFAAAEAVVHPPSAAELRADIETFGITSLFDGDALERI